MLSARRSGCKILWWVCLWWVCLHVALYLSPRGISGTTRAIFTNFFVHVVYVCGSILLRHVYDRPHRVSPQTGFLPHWKCIIGQEREMGVHSAGEVCYLQLPCCMLGRACENILWQTLKVLVSKSWHKESIAPSIKSEVHWWLNEGWGQWVIFPGCSECFEFRSVFWHSGLDDTQNIWLTTNCATYPLRFSCGTYGGEKPRGNQLTKMVTVSFRTWRTLINVALPI